MNPSKPLKRLLENLGKSYARREVNVEFDDQPRITEDGETIYVWNNPGEVLGLDVSGANEFRLVRDALNHEVAHDRWSVLDGKAEFAARYREDGYARVAGTVMNVLEDAYIDSRRLAEYPGLRQAHAFFSESQMRTDVSELDDSNALVSCIHQIAQSGRVNGIRDAPEDVRGFAAWVRPHVEAVRRADDPDEREAIAARVTDELVSRLPEKPDLDDLLDELADAASGDEASEREVENAEPSEIDADQIPDDLAELEPPEDGGEASEAELTDEAAEKVEELLEDADESPGDEDDEPGEGEQADADGEDAPESEGGEDAGDESGDDENAESDGQGGADGDESVDADGEAGEQGGEDAGDEAGHETDALGDELAELDELDERGESPEWHGVDEGDDYESASEADERRYERVESEDAYMNETPIGRRKRERDKSMSSPSLHTKDASAEQVRQVLRESGLARDVRRAFEQFATEDVTVTDETGDRMNLERVVEHMSGNYGVTDVYETDYTAATGGRVIGVALDVSGSMRDDGSELVNEILDGHRGAIVDAKVALGAIHLAANELGDELVSSAFHTPSRTGASTPLITGPGESFEWDHLDTVTCGGRTPTAHGVLDALGLIRAQGGKDELMLVVTDGLPKTSHPDLDGNTYAEDAAIAVNMARAQGVGVIGVGVGDDVRRSKMARMFGSDGYVMTDSENLVSELVGLYADELDYDRPPGY